VTAVEAPTSAASPTIATSHAAETTAVPTRRRVRFAQTISQTFVFPRVEQSPRVTLLPRGVRSLLTATEPESPSSPPVTYARRPRTVTSPDADSSRRVRRRRQLESDEAERANQLRQLAEIDDEVLLEETAATNAK
jgi:hypothetical protein